MVCELLAAGSSPGELVLIEAPALAEPLVRRDRDARRWRWARCRACGWPPRASQQAFLSEAGEEQLTTMLPSAMPEMAAIDLRIAIHAAWNTRELSGVDPARLAAGQRGRERR